MRLKDFYAKDEAVLSAVYDERKALARFLISDHALSVDEGNKFPGQISYPFSSKKVFHVNIQCSPKEFRAATFSLENNMNKHHCRCRQ